MNIISYSVQYYIPRLTIFIYIEAIRVQNFRAFCEGLSILHGLLLYSIDCKERQEETF